MHEVQLYITQDSNTALNLVNLVPFYLPTKFSTPSELGDVAAQRTAVAERYLPTPPELWIMTARGVVPTPSELRNTTTRTLPTYPLRIMERRHRNLPYSQKQSFTYKSTMV